MIVGLTRGTNRSHLVRATVESLAYQTADVLTAMEKDSELQICNLKVDGGASANDFLMKFQSDLLNTEDNGDGSGIPGRTVHRVLEG